jgi:endonuclease/exonuclease/phosphatase family metal-dependent hydrolase
MSRSIRVLFIFICCGVMTYCSEGSKPLKAMSYNIRYDSPNDGDNKWDNRKLELVEFLKTEKAVVIGLQESLKHQLDFILEELPTYDFVGVGRDDGKEKGEYAPILYDTEDMTVLDYGVFWLSETPDVVSTGWDAALPRICTYAHLKRNNDEQEFLAFNTHFDHVGVEARINSVELIFQKIEELNSKQLPVVLMGDFNLRPQDAPIKFLSENLDDGLSVAQKPFSGEQGTFNGFKDTLYDRIDYIFSKNLVVLEYIHSTNKRNNALQLSDHVPVIGVYSFRD